MMLHLPRTPRQWTVAVVSALTGFFFGGAIVAATQKLMRRLLNV